MPCENVAVNPTNNARESRTRMYGQGRAVPKLYRPENHTIVEYMQSAYSKDWPDISEAERQLFLTIIATASAERWKLVPDLTETISDRIRSGESLKKSVGYRIQMGTDRVFYDLIGFPLSGQRLTEPQLSSANLAGADLSRLTIVGGTLSNAILEETKMDLLRASDCDFSTAILKAASLVGAQFENVSLIRAGFQKAVLLETTFKNVDLRGASFEGAFLDFHLLGCQVDASTVFNDDLSSNTWINLGDSAKVRIANQLKLVFRSAGLTSISRRFYYTEMRSRKGSVLQRIRRQFDYAVVPSDFDSDSYEENFKVVEKQGDLETIEDYLTRLENWRQLPDSGTVYRSVARDSLELVGLHFLDILFGFGERPYRILRAVAFVVVTFAIMYMITGLIVNGEVVRLTDYRFDPSWEGAVTLSKLAATALYFSVVTLTTLGYGDISPPGWSMLFAASEALLGIVLSALFVVTLTRKYVLD